MLPGILIILLYFEKYNASPMDWQFLEDTFKVKSTTIELFEVEIAT